MLTTKIFLIGMLWFAGEVADKPKLHSHIAFVVRIIDGDTFVIRDTANRNISVRIIGIDCPETKNNKKCIAEGNKGKRSCETQIPLGKIATVMAKESLEGKQVILECDGACRKDLYKRPLHFVRLPSGVDFGLQLVEKGLCEEVSSQYPHPRQQAYREAQQQAKKSNLGIWKKAEVRPEGEADERTSASIRGDIP